MPNLAPGDRIAGRYAVARALGRGAMGTVWLCRDEVLGRDVAVKQIGGFAGEDPRATDRARREARAAAAIGHPGAVAVYDIVEGDDAPWLIMEYVPGTTLADLVRERGPLPTGSAARMGAEVASALAAAHAAGVVHRDVKPGNILVDEAGRAKISDFGIARAQGDDQLTQVGFVTGTPAYFSPELARGESPSPASDVWALGATLYFAVEGRLPYDSDPNPLTVLRRIDTTDPHRPVHAGSFGLCLGSMMERGPERRWSMAEASTRLDAFATGGAQAAFADDAATTVVPRDDHATRTMVAPTVAGGWQRDDGHPDEVATHGSGSGRGHGERRGRSTLVLAALAVLLVAGVAGFLALSALAGDDSSSSGSTAGPSAPPSATQTASTSTPRTSSTQSASSSDAPSPTQTPSSSSESASSPSPPSSPSSEPTPTDAQEPAVTDETIDSFLSDYYKTVGKDPGTAWTMLTPDAQEQGGGYDSYVAFWENDVKKVKIDDISPQADDMTATATITYESPDKETSSETMAFTFVDEDGQLMIDSFEVV